MKRPSPRYLFAAAAALAVVPVPAAACVFLPVTTYFAPPRGMTEPAQIARWQAREERRAAERERRERPARMQREWDAAKAALAAQAALAPNLSTSRLAASLVTNLLPPLLPKAPHSTSSCDGELVLGPRDPAGLLTGSESPLKADEAAIRAANPDLADVPFTANARRYLREEGVACEEEFTGRLRALLEERFSRGELEQAWAKIHALGYDFDWEERGRRSDNLAYRILAFAEGRSGPLVVYPKVGSVASAAYTDTAAGREQAEFRRELERFLTAEPVGRRLVQTIEQALPQDRLAMCPAALAEAGTAIRARLGSGGQPAAAAR